MQKRTLTIPADVQNILFKLGTLPNPVLATLSIEEERAAAATRQADYERIKATVGNFQNAVREGHWDDGQQLIKDASLYTGENVDQIEAAGFRLIDAYQTSTVKDGETKPQVVVIFSKDGVPTARVTDEVKAAVRMHLTFNWYRTFVWYNPHSEVPNLTINAFGVLRKGTPENLELVASNNVAADQPA